MQAHREKSIGVNTPNGKKQRQKQIAARRRETHQTPPVQSPSRPVNVATDAGIRFFDSSPPTQVRRPIAIRPSAPFPGGGGKI